MKAKKLMTLCLAGILAVTATTTILAAGTGTGTGNTTVTFNPNGAGPVDPVDPGYPDNDPNNWMVYFPSQVALGSANVTENDINTVSATDVNTVGSAMKFTVQRRLPGSSGNMSVSEGNVGNGIKVDVAPANKSTWDDNDKGIKMLLGNVSGNIDNNAIMAIKTSDSELASSTNTDLVTLTSTAATNSDTKVAVIKNSSIKDGARYVAQLTYTFTRMAK